MQWEQVLRWTRVVFLVSAGAVSVGFLSLVPALLGWDATTGTLAVVATVGTTIMGVGGVTAGISGLILLTS